MNKSDQIWSLNIHQPPHANRPDDSVRFPRLPFPLKRAESQLTGPLHQPTPPPSPPPALTQTALDLLFVCLVLIGLTSDVVRVCAHYGVLCFQSSTTPPPLPPPQTSQPPPCLRARLPATVPPISFVTPALQARLSRRFISNTSGASHTHWQTHTTPCSHIACDHGCLKKSIHTPLHPSSPHPFPFFSPSSGSLPYARRGWRCVWWGGLE